jgi:hypothetical protein
MEIEEKKIDADLLRLIPEKVWRRTNAGTYSRGTDVSFVLASGEVMVSSVPQKVDGENCDGNYTSCRQEGQDVQSCLPENVCYVILREWRHVPWETEKNYFKVKIYCREEGDIGVGKGETPFPTGILMRD